MNRRGGLAAASLLLCLLLIPACSGATEPEQGAGDATGAEATTEDVDAAQATALETDDAGVEVPLEPTDTMEPADVTAEVTEAGAGPLATPPPGAAPLPTGEEPAGGFLAPENQQRILLFFPSASRARLVPEQRIIFLTDTLTSQVKQAVSELIAGPMTAGLLRPFPRGTALKGVFLPGTGIALIDLGSEAQTIPGGSEWEQAALYSLVNTVVHNFADIHQVQILVQGQEVETLAGHLDTSRPLAPSMGRVDWPFQRLLDESGDFLPYGIGPALPEGWVKPDPLPDPLPEPKPLPPWAPDVPQYTPVPEGDEQPEEEEPPATETILLEDDAS
jgi:hypothetical protein